MAIYEQLSRPVINVTDGCADIGTSLSASYVPKPQIRRRFAGTSDSLFTVACSRNLHRRAVSSDDALPGRMSNDGIGGHGTLAVCGAPPWRILLRRLQRQAISSRRATNSGHSCFRCSAGFIRHTGPRARSRLRAPSATPFGAVSRIRPVSPLYLSDLTQFLPSRYSFGRPAPGIATLCHRISPLSCTRSRRPRCRLSPQVGNPSRT